MKVDKYWGTISKIFGLCSILVVTYFLVDLSYASKHASYFQEIAALKKEVVRLRNSIPENTQISEFREDLNLLRKDVTQLQNELFNIARINHNNLPKAMEQAMMPEEKPFFNDIEDALQSEQQFFSAVENRLTSEIADSKWSMAANVAINRAFEQAELSGFSIFNIDCRSSICRIDVLIDENKKTSPGELPMYLLPRIAGQFPGFSMQVPDDVSETGMFIVYLSEEPLN